ncbi:6874_t:CDS:10 [Entrophospora sp. SA101]|nr:6874_t:CDS:10 [Entrophospora sp. SA101]
MGATDSKLAFRKGVFRLFEERNIGPNDEYWSQFWILPETSEDVFSLIGAQDIRRVRDHARENLETLILKTFERILVVVRAPDFPSPQNSILHLLNCIRILTRIMPFIFESEDMEEWEENFFWTAQTRKSKKNRKLEVVVDNSIEETNNYESQNINNTDENNENINYTESIETIPPLGERLLSVVIELLFLAGFTLPISLTTQYSRVIPVNWETGVGSTIPVGSSKENDVNKTETLRLLLTLISRSMYMSAATFISKENKWIKYLVLKRERKVVLALLCSILNTAVKYNPAGWGVPYNHVMFADTRETLVALCLQVLLVLLDYPISTETTSSDRDSILLRNLPPNVDNVFRHYTSKLHRTQDFQFIMDGIYRILSNPMQANNTYLPGSTKQIRCYQETLMLCWKFLEINKRFRNYLFDTDRVLDILIVLIYYALENKNDTAQLGLLRMCAFILQTLSSDREFAIRLNKVFEGHGSLPGNVRIPAFYGTYADYMIISIYALIATTRGALHSLYPAFILTITNVSPYLKNLSVVSSTKLVQLFSSFTAPGFLLSEEGNHRLVEYMLEAFNNIIQHQYADNPNLVYAIVRNPKKFEELSQFTLARGLTEIKKVQLAKEQRKKQSKNIPNTGDVNEKTTMLRISSQFDNNQSEMIEYEEGPMPPLSEKARGKLPEVGKSGFVPTEDWVSSWHSNLQIGTILLLLSELIPKVQSMCMTQSITTDQEVLEYLKSVTLVGILPLPQPILIRQFLWSEASVVWFSSILWGQIYLASSNHLVYRDSNEQVYQKIHAYSFVNSTSLYFTSITPSDGNNDGGGGGIDAYEEEDVESGRQNDNLYLKLLD